MSTTASCFAQVLSLVDRNDFARAVIDRDGERGAKGFSCWDQFVSMMFCQMGGANSLREICGGLATAMGKLVHLGMDEAPHRSTLAYANEHRPWQIYEDMFYSVLSRCQALAATKKRKLAEDFLAFLSSPETIQFMADNRMRNDRNLPNTPGPWGPEQEASPKGAERAAR